MRQKNQVELNLGTGAKGEAPSAAAQESEARAAEACLERPAVVGPSMEAVVERENLKKALARVKRNKGAGGIDGMSVEDLPAYLKEHWPTIGAQLLEGTYKPRFVRYADDCNIYVRSQRAGERVMAGIEAFLAKRLKLKVNKAKSAVAKPSVRKFLGFSFTGGREPRRRIAPLALDRFKARVRELTRRTRGRSLAQIVKELSVYLRGWRGYFGFCQTPSVLRALDEWTRRRLRAIAWKQWKRGRTRFAELRRCGVGRDLAAQTAGSPCGPWRISHSPALTIALPIVYFGSIGLTSVANPPPA